jgi:CRISPR-associated protein Csm2
MVMTNWIEKIPEKEITERVTRETVDFAQKFGSYLGTDETEKDTNSNRYRILKAKLTTNQLRKFFGEVKRQQMQGYNEADFVLLKPKLAYAVGRNDKNAKIKDFYDVISDAIDKVKSEEHFKNFIKIFEAIVAYHKAAEEKKIINNEENK